MCLLRGTDWAFKCNSERSRALDLRVLSLSVEGVNDAKLQMCR
jgi:hypothetical protein